MRRIILLILSLAALMTGCAASEVRLFAVNVGKGDALIVQVDGYACLIDTGKVTARGKVLSALDQLDITALDAVFITHTDSDHTDGLEWLAESDIPVGTWYASAYYTGVSAEKHPAVKAAELRGQTVQWLKRGDRVTISDEAAFQVLAPIGPAAVKEDNNSLVMLLETAQGRMLLTGDMELVEEAQLLSQSDDLQCAVLKVPNHADDDTVSAAFAKAVSAQVAIISTDSAEKPGTPDTSVVNRLKAAGSTCYVTQDAALGLSVTLSNGKAEVSYVGIDAPYAKGLTVAEVDPDDDIIVIENSGETVDLTGWYLYSNRGGEWYAFPDGFTIAKGQRVTIGTNTSKGAYDLLWDDKKVIHRKKTDNIALYDRWGRAVDSRSNGL